MSVFEAWSSSGFELARLQPGGKTLWEQLLDLYSEGFRNNEEFKITNPTDLRLNFCKCSPADLAPSHAASCRERLLGQVTERQDPLKKALAIAELAIELAIELAAKLAAERAGI